MELDRHCSGLANDSYVNNDDEKEKKKEEEEEEEEIILHDVLKKNYIRFLSHNLTPFFLRFALT